MIHELYHGTNQQFTAFESRFLGMSNRNAASIEAFFFARDPRTAWDYAHQAARRLVPRQEEHEAQVARLLAQSRTAEIRGRFDLAEKYLLEAEELETTALQAPDAGAVVYRCRIGLDNPLLVDGTSRRVVVDLGSVLRAARAAGHDGVILSGIMDTPSGEGMPDDHFAIFDPARIEIVEILEHEPAPEPCLPDGW